jgi:hypothetical protein
VTSPSSTIASLPPTSTSTSTSTSTPTTAAAPTGSAPAPSASLAATISSPLPVATSHGRDTDLSGERTLVDRARAALARGDPPSALDAIAKHQTAFPRGQLAEEREALAVQALVAAGRVQEAADRAGRFRKAYPTSVFLPVVDEALR